MLAQKIIEGANKAGAGVESFNLPKMTISPCSAGDKCKKADDS
jgi:multimeric flavodoxin WrbA